MGIIAFLVLLLFCYFWNYFRFSQLCALIVTMCRRLAAWAMAFYFMIGQWFLQWCLLKCFCPAATWFLSPVTSAPVLIYILTKKRITNTKILNSSRTDCFSHITVSSALFCVELSLGRKLDYHILPDVHHRNLICFLLNSPYRVFCHLTVTSSCTDVHHTLDSACISVLGLQTRVV